MDLPDIKKYNQDLKEKRIKWVEDKKLDPLWKESFNQEYNHEFIIAKNLHLKLFPIEIHQSKIFSPQFIERYKTNLMPLISSKYQYNIQTYKELIVNKEITPDHRKIFMQGFQLEVNLFKVNAKNKDIYPAMLNFLNITLDDIIKTRAEIYSLRDTIKCFLEYSWFKEFVDLISNDGSFINEGEVYDYYLGELYKFKNEKLGFVSLMGISKNDEILNKQSYKYGKYIVHEHFRFFSNICHVLVTSDYLPNKYLSKEQLKLIISNFTKLYKLIYNDEMNEFKRKENIKKTSEKRGKSKRSDDLCIKIQYLKEQGNTKKQINLITEISLPTIRKYWDLNKLVPNGRLKN